jgi:hypothetical protein
MPVLRSESDETPQDYLRLDECKKQEQKDDRIMIRSCSSPPIKKNNNKQINLEDLADFQTKKEGGN